MIARRHLPWMIATAIIFFVVSVPVFWGLASNASRFEGAINDWIAYEPYYDYTRFWPPRSASAHFMYPMLVHAARTLVNTPVAATVVVSTAFGALGAVLYRIGGRTWDDRPPLGPIGAVSLPLVFLLAESPTLLVRATSAGWWTRPSFDPMGTGAGVFLLHVWGSPPSVLQLPFALALLVALVGALEPDLATIRTPSTAQMAALTVLATVAKPAATLVFLVAVPLYAFADPQAPATAREPRTQPRLRRSGPCLRCSAGRVPQQWRVPPPAGGCHDRSLLAGRVRRDASADPLGRRRSGGALPDDRWAPISRESTDQVAAVGYGGIAGAHVHPARNERPPSRTTHWRGRSSSLFRCFSSCRFTS